MSPGWVTQALAAACELRLPDLIGEGVDEPAALALACGCDERRLTRVLDALTEARLLERDVKGRYRCTPVSARLTETHPQSLRRTLLWKAERECLAWRELPAVVRLGGSGYEHAFGEPLYDALRSDSALAARFDAMMEELARLVPDAIVREIAGRCGGVLVDVGGGRGGFARRLLGANPDLEVILFERPEVASAVEAGARLTVVAGDFFHAVPDGDAISLVRVLHNWDDAAALRILRACRAKLRVGALLFIVDRLRDGSQKGGAVADLSMLVQTGGQLRSAPEYHALAEAAGFHPELTLRSSPPFTLLIMIARD